MAARTFRRKTKAMGLFDSISQWFKQTPSDRSGSPGDDVPVPTILPRRSAGLDSTSAPEIAVGTTCLMTVTDRLFMVKIVDVTNDTIRVTFPGIDYPVEGMLIDLEFHDLTGFSYYQAIVLEGPQKVGDGILLEKPTDAKRIRHRDSCRVATDLKAELKDQAHVKTHPARIMNLSTSGALIETEAYFELDTTLEVKMTLPDNTTHDIIVQIVHVNDTVQSESQPVHCYGTRFVGYEPGTGRDITRYIWAQLKTLYPIVSQP
jgi:hypothetical protein